MRNESVALQQQQRGLDGFYLLDSVRVGELGTRGDGALRV